MKEWPRRMILRSTKNGTTSWSICRPKLLLDKNSAKKTLTEASSSWTSTLRKSKNASTTPLTSLETFNQTTESLEKTERGKTSSKSTPTQPSPSTTRPTSATLQERTSPELSVPVLKINPCNAQPQTCPRSSAATMITTSVHLTTLSRTS